MLNSINYNSFKTQTPLPFEGKKFVEQKFLGEKDLIPRSVHDAKQSVRLIWGVTKNREIIQANGVYLGNNLFLSAGHLFIDEKTEKLYPYKSIYAGKEFKNANKIYYNVNKISLVNYDDVYDLALAKIEDKNINIKPIKIAKNPPKAGETVYLIGTKEPLRGNKAIPFTLLNKEKDEESFEYRLSNDFLNKFDSNNINMNGFSGSPIVNSKGELVSILKAGFAKNDIMLGAKLIDIKEFLRKNNISF